MADPLHSDTVLKRHRPTRARSAYSHAAVPAKHSKRCHSQNGRRGSCSSNRWPRKRARCLPRSQEGHGIAHGRLPIDFRHTTAVALMAPVLAAQELCRCSIQELGPRPARPSNSSERFLCKRWYVPRPRPRQPSRLDSAAAHSRRARAPRSRAPALLHVRRARRRWRAATTPTSRARSSSSGGGGTV